jgi:hypothetical protein
MPGSVEGIPLLLSVEVLLTVLKHIHIHMPATEQMVGLRK